MIELSHVYKTYNESIHALKNIHLFIDKSEFVFLTGPSGAGKSTLFKMISAFDLPTSGQIKVTGQLLNEISGNDLAQFRRKIGIVFQDFRLIRSKTIFENVALPLQIKGEKSNQIYKKVNEILDQVGLIHRRDQYPEYVSGGEQQRTAIARAIVHQPGVLVADEPTGNLDPQLSEEIIDLLEKVCARGTTVFVATHNQELVRRRKKRTIELLNGCLKEAET